VCQCCVLTCQSIPLVSLDCDYALGAWHLHSGVGIVDDCHEFQEEMPPHDAIVTDVKTGHLKRQHLSLCLLSPVPQHTSRSIRPMGVDDCPGITSWNVSCAWVMSFKLRPISIKVFLMIRVNEALLSISVFATLYRLIGSLTTNDKFLSDSSLSLDDLLA
jgi:hypothetical protein